MQLNQPVITNNVASNQTPGGDAFGAGIDNDGHLTIVGPGRVSFNTSRGGRFADGGAIENDDWLDVTNIAFANNLATSNGSLSTNPTSCGGILYPSCTQGAGIANYDYLNMRNSSITGNRAVASTTLINGSVAAQGGGLVNDGTGATLQNTTISGNSVSATGGSTDVMQGGGIWNDEPLNLESSFVQNNTGADKGGGIYDASTSQGYLSFSYSRVTNNTAAIIAGGVYNPYPIQNVSSTIQFNTAPTCPNTLHPCQ